MVYMSFQHRDFDDTWKHDELEKSLKVIFALSNIPEDFFLSHKLEFFNFKCS